MKAALRWYVKSAKAKCVPACRVVGNHFFNQERYSKAFEHLLFAAKNGNEESYFQVGYCYAEGKGISPNAKLAKHWFSLGAKAKQPICCYAMGKQMLGTGDDREGRELIDSAIAGGGPQMLRRLEELDFLAITP